MVKPNLIYMIYWLTGHFDTPLIHVVSMTTTPRPVISVLQEGFLLLTKNSILATCAYQ